MTHPENPADGADAGTPHHVPDGPVGTPGGERPPTSDTPFVPPYAEHVDAPTPVDPAAAAFAFADVHAEPVASPSGHGAAAPTAPPTVTGPTGSSTLAERARRWGAPAALVAAGLLGGMAVTGAVTNASASTPASTSTISDSGTRGSGSGGDRATDAGPGLTLDQLDGTPDAGGDHAYGADNNRSAHGDGHRSGGRSVSDGFTLAPSTQGTTGASG